jgi:hypothetical protein
MQITWRLSRINMGKHACDERNAAYSVAASSEWSSTEESGSGGWDLVGGGGYGRRGIGIARLGFSMAEAEVGKGDRERAVDVKPGMRRPTKLLYALRVLHSDPAGWRGIGVENGILVAASLQETPYASEWSSKIVEVIRMWRCVCTSASVLVSTAAVIPEMLRSELSARNKIDDLQTYRVR